jgi:hypothetical protein
MRLTAASHLLNSSFVQFSGLPLGSSAAGNMSPPHIAHAATAVTIPVKAVVMLVPDSLHGCFHAKLTNERSP